MDYGKFIGKLLSYVPFFENDKFHAMHDIVKNYCILKGIEYKEEILRNYIFIQLHDCLPSFFKLFLKK